MNKKNFSEESLSDQHAISEIELGKLRKKIDTLDIQIQELISQRVEVAYEVARVKLEACLLYTSPSPRDRG